jgi:hypothetical protein
MFRNGNKFTPRWPMAQPRFATHEGDDHMKRFALATVVVLACAAGATGASAGKLKLSLDGYCNTFDLHTDGILIYGSRSGCGYTDIDGGTVAKVHGVQYDITNDTNDSAEIFTWYFTPPKSGAQDWYLYEATATGSSELASGTYTLTSGGAARQPGPDVVKTKARIMHELPVR